ncbi:MAG: discoidin domain-containing protein [Akkermansia sp.]
MSTQDFNAPSLDSARELFPEYQFIQLLEKSAHFVSYRATEGEREGGASIIIYLFDSQRAETASFMEMAQKAITLSNPSLISIQSAGQRQEFFYIVIEDSLSPSLQQALQGDTLDVKKALMQLRLLAMGITQAHDLGIYHGGINPSSILLERGNHLRCACLAMPLDTINPEQITYQAPELTTGTPPDASTDIYSLGMVLYLLLTGKTPQQTKGLMPSYLCPCSEEVDLLTAKAIHPDRASRFSNLMELIVAIEKSLPACNKPKQRPKQSLQKISVSSNLSQLHAKPKEISPLYFYLLPILMIGIVVAYTSLSYKKDIADIYNEGVLINTKRNAELRAEQSRITKAFQEGREYVPTVPVQPSIPTTPKEKAPVHQKQATPPAPTVTVATSTTPTPTPTSGTGTSPETTKDEAPHLADHQDMTNWCRQPQARAKLSSIYQNLNTFGAQNAIDGDTDTAADAKSISATDPTAKESTPWFMIDLGKDTHHLIYQIVIYAPSEDNPTKTSLTNYKIKLIDGDKKVILEKDFHTDGSPVASPETWELDTPIQARGIRIESLDPNQPIVISELEAYGK